MVLYGLGFIAIFRLFVLLYHHAWRRRDALGLDALETFEARLKMEPFAIYIGVGCLPIAIVLIGGSEQAFCSGMSYALLGPAAATHGTWRARAWKRIAAGRRAG